MRAAIMCGAFMGLAITTASAQASPILGKFCAVALESCIRGGSGLRPPGHGAIVLERPTRWFSWLPPSASRSRTGWRSCKYCWPSSTSSRRIRREWMMRSWGWLSSAARSVAMPAPVACP